MGGFVTYLPGSILKNNEFLHNLEPGSSHPFIVLKYYMLHYKELATTSKLRRAYNLERVNISQFVQFICTNWDFELLLRALGYLAGYFGSVRNVV
jgi:hypothetical protein